MVLHAKAGYQVLVQTEIWKLQRQRRCKYINQDKNTRPKGKESNIMYAYTAYQFDI